MTVCPGSSQLTWLNVCPLKVNKVWMGNVTLCKNFNSKYHQFATWYSTLSRSQVKTRDCTGYSNFTETTEIFVAQKWIKNQIVSVDYGHFFVIKYLIFNLCHFRHGKSYNREYLKKKKQKKQQRFKQIEEERESEKNKWLSFHTKASKKPGVRTKSIFASPDNLTGRVGIGTCGISGQPMTNYTPGEKWKKGG